MNQAIDQLLEIEQKRNEKSKWAWLAVSSGKRWWDARRDSDLPSLILLPPLVIFCFLSFYFTVCTKQTRALGVARLGSFDSQQIVSGTLEELQLMDLGPPLHSLVSHFNTSACYSAANVCLLVIF